jgi:hypothetical protein
VELFNIWNHQSALTQFQDLHTRLQVLATGQSRELLLADEVQQGACRTLQEFETECKALGLDSVASLASFARFQCDKPSDKRLSYANLFHSIQSIDFLFRVDSAKQRFLRLSQEEADLFDAPHPFGAEVSAAFNSPETKHEISEAAKCIVLSRYTACVFHLMRVLEKGLKALSDHLDVRFEIPFEYLNWQNIIEPIESRIRELDKQKQGVFKAEQLKTYSEAAKQFRYFKDAWRNHVAHSRETYGPEQALSIMRHVREFMNDLAKMGLTES